MIPIDPPLRDQRLELHQDVKRRLAERREILKRTMHAPDPAPRYDKVFFEGVKWLDGLADDPGDESVTQ